MKILTTKSNKFKGMELTKDERNEVLDILKGSCFAVAERELAKLWNIDKYLASRILGAVFYNYKWLKVIENDCY